jgi:hypothetical protein
MTKFTIGKVSLHSSLANKNSEHFPFSQMAVHKRQENHAFNEKKVFPFSAGH